MSVGDIEADRVILLRTAVGMMLVSAALVAVVVVVVKEVASAERRNLACRFLLSCAILICWLMCVSG